MATCPTCLGRTFIKVGPGELTSCPECKGRGSVSDKKAQAAKQLREGNIGASKHRGRFADANLDRLCVCGHRKGVHTAHKPHECLGEDGASFCDKECTKFRAARTPKAKKEAPMPSKKSAAQLNREIAESLSRGGKLRFASTLYKGPSSLMSSKPAKPRVSVDPKSFGGSSHAVGPINNETFTCMDRNGKVLGTSSSVQGAMSKAPNDKSYALVRGEYVSTGDYFGPGRGRQMAVREQGRWVVG